MDILYIDKEIADLISIDKKPSSELGLKVAEEIEKTAIEQADSPSPCEFIAYEDEKIVVKIIEPEENTKLMGPAFNNFIYVFDGGIYGLSEKSLRDKMDEEIVKKGIKTNISYIRALAALAAYGVENNSSKEIKIQVKNTKSWEDVNVNIPDTVVKFISGKNKKIRLRGPVFSTIIIQRKVVR
jgi:O-phosphoseryl-tRNA synthetase